MLGKKGYVVVVVVVAEVMFLAIIWVF